MARNYFFILAALLAVGVLPLTISAPLTHALSTSGGFPSSSPISTTHPGSNSTLYVDPGVTRRAPTPPSTTVFLRTSEATAKVAPAVFTKPGGQNNRTPIIIVVCVLFGIPLVLLVGLSCVTMSCSRRKPCPDPDTDLNTWDVYRREAAVAVVKQPHSLSFRRGTGPSPFARHIPRRPSPLRQVYPAAHILCTPRTIPRGRRAVADPPSVPGSESDCTYSEGAASPVSDAPPRTPVSGAEDQLECVAVGTDHDNLVYRASFIAKYDEDARIEKDVSDAYDEYFALTREEHERGDFAHWYIISTASTSDLR